MKILKRLLQVISIVLFGILLIISILLSVVLLIPYFIITGRIIFRDLFSLLDYIPDTVITYLHLDQ